MDFDVNVFDVEQYNAILDRGLSNGIGNRDGQMCIEAAICTVLGLDHGDDPECVTSSVRSFKISLNDKRWSSPKARAEGLRKLGLAQLGSIGVVGSVAFTKSLSEKLIRIMVPKLLRKMYPKNFEIQALADRCEAEGTTKAARDTRDHLKCYAYAAYAAAHAADAAAYAAAHAADAAYAAAHAADAAAHAASDEWLTLAADLALEVLVELKSPGCALLK